MTPKRSHILSIRPSSELTEPFALQTLPNVQGRQTPVHADGVVSRRRDLDSAQKQVRERETQSFTTSIDVPSNTSAV